MLATHQKELLHKCASSLRSCTLQERKPIIENLSEALGLSDKSIRRHLKNECGWQPQTKTGARKQRADKGTSYLNEEYIANTTSIIETLKRDSGKYVMSTKLALEIQQANNNMPVDKNGEVRQPSASTFARKQKDLGYHKSQLKHDKPAIQMRVPHPNHTGQVDASVCVVWYLENGKAIITKKEEYNDNKPKALERARKNMVWRYVYTDYYSGAISVWYEQNQAEDAIGVVNALIQAFCKKPYGYPVHGVPKQLLMDKGAGNMSNYVKKFCEQLGIKILTHSTANARVKGQVENANNIVETHFESRLRTMEINSLADLQDSVDKWCAHYNEKYKHSRTKVSRNEAWLRITQDQLKYVEKDVLREIATWQHIKRKVNQYNQISITTKKFGTHVYSLHEMALHNVHVGDEVEVVLNPFKAPNVLVSKTLYNGEVVSMDIAPLVMDDAGFLIDAPIIGEEHKAHKTSTIEKNVDEMKKLAYQTETAEEADKLRKKKVKPFMDYNFMADVEETLLQNKKRIHFAPTGEAAIKAPVIEEQVFDLTETAMRLRHLCKDWTLNPHKSMAWLEAKGENFKESEIKALAKEFDKNFVPYAKSINIDFEAVQNG